MISTTVALLDATFSKACTKINAPLTLISKSDHQPCRLDSAIGARLPGLEIARILDQGIDLFDCRNCGGDGYPVSGVGDEGEDFDSGVCSFDVLFGCPECHFYAAGDG